MKKLITFLILLNTLMYAQTGENADETYESFNGKVISYNPPKRFYITYQLTNGDVHTEYISKRCSVKSNIIGMEVYVTKYTHKQTKKVTYQLHHDKEYFCN